MSTLIPVVLGCTVMASTLETNDAGVPWKNSIDDWGRTWADAASDFYDRLEGYRTALIARGEDPATMQFAVGVETSLRKVFQPKLWFKGDLQPSVTLYAARGEYESFQAVVCPIAETERALAKLSPEAAQGDGALTPHAVKIDAVTLSPLEHESQTFRITGDDVRIYRVGYVPTLPVQYPVRHVGQWPDPLLPFAPFTVANPQCQPLWVDIHVPREAPPGRYTGRLTVEGPHPVAVTVTLVVWDFALPDPPTFSMGWSLHDWFREGGTDALLQRLEVLLDHRFAPWHAAYPLHENLEEHDRVMGRLLERGVPLQATSGEPSEAFVNHLRRRGWLDRYMCLWGDEPHDRDYPTYRERTETIHQRFPGLVVAMTDEPTPDNVGLFDLWIAEPSAQDDAQIQAAMQRGDRVWWYLCHVPIHASYPGPIHACPGMVLDRPAVDHRITFWMAYQQGIEGVSYWAVSSWPGGFERWPNEPWPANDAMSFPYGGRPNGNGFLCYPGTDGMPWPSIRLKCMRDGLEDYDYLRTLQARQAARSGVDRRVEVEKELVMGLRYFNRDPQALLRTRQRLAEQILAERERP